MDAILRSLVASLGQPPLDGDTAARLLTFAELVDVWRRKINLTGVKSTSELAEVLFADALVLSEVDPSGEAAIVPHDARVIDVGAGAGAPTLPLLLLRPDLNAVLIEPIGKRRAFLRTVIGSLRLRQRCEVKDIHVDRESAGALGAFDVALSRATFHPDEWRSLGAMLAPRVVVFTAESVFPEVAQKVITYRLPSGAPRRIAVFE